MEWRRIRIVWRWEFLQRIRSKSFVYSLLFVPFVFFLFTALPAAFVNDSSSAPVLGISGFRDWQTAQLRSFSPESVTLLPLPGDLLEKDTKQLTEFAIDGVLYYNGEAPKLLILTREHATALIDAANEMVTRMRLQNLGLETRSLKTATEKIPVEIDARAGDGLLENYRIAITIVMMLFFAMFNSSGAFLRSLSEERHNKIMEVLIATIKPSTLMTGKILGLACVGLLQLAIWSVLGLAWTDTPFLQVLAWHSWLVVIVYFLLGYLFYTGLFASIGSVLSSESDIQHLQAVLSILGLLPAALLAVIINDPQSLVVAILSYVPLITPTLMPLRIILSETSAPQVAGTLFLMLVSAAGMVFVAGQVFKASILLRGAPSGIRFRKIGQ